MYVFFLLTIVTSVLAFQNVPMRIPISDILRGGRQPKPQQESWTGKWFPGNEPPTTSHPAVSRSRDHGGIPMGLNPNCDDGKTNLTLDQPSVWDFTCFNPTRRITPNYNIRPNLDIENIPKHYSAPHYCMNETINYLESVPTFGPHRPVWPRYGEYKFLPVQRWLHSLEHGAVVMLYHPCAHPLEVNRLRILVTSCLYRHVISPTMRLSLERPLALLTWGKRLSLSTAHVEIVKDFIKQNALQGPEKVSQDGQYEIGLIKPALIVSDTEDSDLCPVQNFRNPHFG